MALRARRPQHTRLRQSTSRQSQPVQVLFEPQTETSHLIQALRESVPPQDIYKLHKATLDSIPWDPEGGETLRPAPIPRHHRHPAANRQRPSAEHTRRPTRHQASSRKIRSHRHGTRAPKTRRRRRHSASHLRHSHETHRPLRSEPQTRKPSQSEPTPVQPKAAPEALQIHARQRAPEETKPSTAKTCQTSPRLPFPAIYKQGSIPWSRSCTGFHHSYWSTVLPLCSEDRKEGWRCTEAAARDRHPGLSDDFTPGTPDIQTWPVMSLRRLERRGVLSCQIRCPRSCDTQTNRHGQARQEQKRPHDERCETVPVRNHRSCQLYHRHNNRKNRMCSACTPPRHYCLVCCKHSCRVVP